MEIVLFLVLLYFAINSLDEEKPKRGGLGRKAVRTGLGWGTKAVMRRWWG